MSSPLSLLRLTVPLLSLALGTAACTEDNTDATRAADLVGEISDAHNRAFDALEGQCDCFEAFGYDDEATCVTDFDGGRESVSLPCLQDAVSLDLEGSVDHFECSNAESNTLSACLEAALADCDADAYAMCGSATESCPPIPEEVSTAADAC